MYKEFTATEWRKLLGLVDDYSISSMLVYGAWDKEKQRIRLEKALTAFGVQFTVNTLPGFLSGVTEIVVGGKCFWFGVSYGGALLSEYLHLACMLGSQKNILLGTCGGLFDQLNSGDFILPTFSYGDESTTRLYSPESVDHKHFPNELLGESLAKRIDAKYRVWRGPTNTCQAMMAETLKDIEEWAASGYYGVEMEAATIFAVSNHFKVPASALLVVGDNLIKGEAVGGEGYENARSIREEATAEQYRVALEELLA